MADHRHDRFYYILIILHVFLSEKIGKGSSNQDILDMLQSVGYERDSQDYNLLLKNLKSDNILCESNENFLVNNIIFEMLNRNFDYEIISKSKLINNSRNVPESIHTSKTLQLVIVLHAFLRQKTEQPYTRNDVIKLCKSIKTEGNVSVDALIDDLSYMIFPIRINNDAEFNIRMDIPVFFELEKNFDSVQLRVNENQATDNQT